VKALFLFLCTLNVIFVLWQFHSGQIDLPVSQPAESLQILTVDEYARAKRGAEIAQIIQSGTDAWQNTELDRVLGDLRPQIWKPIALPRIEPTPVPPQPQPEVAVLQPTKPPEPTAPPIKNCFEVGPFFDQAEATHWLEQNQLTGSRIFSREQRIAGDFQVYFPAAKTAEQSLANKIMLREHGIKDIWMIPDGDKKGAYSLAVFKEKDRAVLFKTQLAARGVASEIRQRDRSQTQWFSKVMLDKLAAKRYEAQAVQIQACTGN
jgi:hypothetical protein